MASNARQQYRTAVPEDFPEEMTIMGTVFRKRRGLRYGENPGMPAAWYDEAGSTGPGTANYEVIQEAEDGKLGFINLLDLNAGLAIVKRIKELFPGYVASSVSKHVGPSGTARGDSTFESYNRAWDTDPLSAFGSVVSFSDRLDGETANLMMERFFECVISPGYTPEALEALRKRPRVRVISVPSVDTALVDANYQFVKTRGGLLVQRRFESGINSPENFRVLSQRQPTPDELNAALFGWGLTPFVPSNSVMLVTPYETKGIGSGQRSRIDSTRLSIYYSNTKPKVRGSAGTTLVSDAFFPFRDSADLAGISGVACMVAPLGSPVGDEETRQASNEYGMALLAPTPNPENPNDTERGFVHLAH